MKVSEQSWLFHKYLEETFKDMDARTASGEGYDDSTPEQAKANYERELAMADKFGGIDALLAASETFGMIVRKSVGLLESMQLVERSAQRLAAATAARAAAEGQGS